MKRLLLNVFILTGCFMSALFWKHASVNSFAAMTRINDYKNESEVEKAKKELYKDYLKKIKNQKKELESGKITLNGQTMKFSMKIIGDPDKNGYPLYFGLRGGGVEDDINAEKQYKLMQNYYSCNIKKGIYIVTQPVDACWNEHYLPEMFPFYDRLIEDTIAFCDVDPNRVYFMGFSSGGDGVFGIAPIIADRLAAVNSSAGCPHVYNLGSMYRLPICLQVGENDSAHDRNTLVPEYGELLDKYAKQYGGGYIHEVFIHKGGNHNNWDDIYDKPQPVYTGDQAAVWLKDRSSAKAVERNTSAPEWVSRYTRDPLPEKLVWEQKERAYLRKTQAFYWLDCDNVLYSKTPITASYDRSRNAINIAKCSAKSGVLKVYLNPRMVDVFKNVTVNYGNYSVILRPYVSKKVMQYTLEARGDKNYIFTSEIDIIFNNTDRPKIVVVGDPYSSSKSDIEKKDSDKSKTEGEGKPNDQDEADSLLQWDKDGLFLVDNRLFDISYAELKKMLGDNISKPQEWDYWGKGLRWSYMNPPDKDKLSVIFMYQHGKTVIIYSEEAGEIPDELIIAARKKYGRETQAVTHNGLCTFTIDNNFYDKLSHIRQMYTYYKYKK